MIWVTAEDVIAIHSRVIQKSGGIDGLRDRSVLSPPRSNPLVEWNCFRERLIKLPVLALAWHPTTPFWMETSALGPWWYNCC